nr:transglutaminase domain-containing protein [Endozoicomonas sp.]
YRLTVKQLVMGNGALQEVSIPCDQGDVELLTNPGWPEGGIRLPEGQQLGCHTVRLSKKYWTPLPGLSAMDELIHLRNRKQQPLVVARSKLTGQLLVKLADKAWNKPITLDFIIKPDQKGLTGLRASDQIQAQSGLCDEAIRQRLDDQVFSRKARFYPACQELQQIKKEASITQRLLKLAQWCREFNDTRDIPGQGLDLLINLIRKKQGICRHRSQVFQVLSQYFGVPARMVSSNQHRYIEISPDGGQHWRKIDLGGGGEYTTDITAPNFADNVTLNISSQKDIVDNIYQMSGRLVDQYIDESTRAQALTEIEAHLSPSSTHRLSRYVPEWLWKPILKKNLEVLRMILASFRKQAEDPPFFHTDPGVVLQDFLNFMQKNYGQDLWLKPENSTLVSDSLYLIEQGILKRICAVLPFLEQLTQHPDYGLRANRLLDSFYQTLTQPREWQGGMTNKRSKPVENIGGQSKTLLRELMQVTVDQGWSQFNTGKLPNVERLVQKQPAFPVSTEGKQARPVFFSNLGVTDDFNADKEFLVFIMDKKSQEKIPALKALADKIKKQELSEFDPIQLHIKAAFFDWLSMQCSTQTRLILVPRKQFVSSEVAAGCYPWPHHPNGIKTMLKDCFCYRSGDSDGVILNPDRIKKAFNSPSALVITPVLLSIAYREYLETMDWSKLLDET